MRGRVLLSYLGALSALALCSSVSAVAAAQLPVFAEPSSEPAAAEVEAASTPSEAPAEPATGAAALAAPAAVGTRPLTAPRPARATWIVHPGPPVEVPLDTTGASDDYRALLGRRWYGWKTLLADGISAGTMLTGWLLEERDKTGGELILVGGALGYLFVPGAIHFSHRNAGRAFVSMGIRLGMPLAGAILGASLTSGCDQVLCEEQGATIGVISGMGAALALDATFLAYERPRGRPQHDVAKARLIPLVSLAPQRALLGIGGSL